MMSIFSPFMSESLHTAVYTWGYGFHFNDFNNFSLSCICYESIFSPDSQVSHGKRQFRDSCKPHILWQILESGIDLQMHINVLLLYLRQIALQKQFWYAVLTSSNTNNICFKFRILLQKALQKFIKGMILVSNNLKKIEKVRV